MAYQPSKLSLPEAIALIAELTDSRNPKGEMLRALQDGALVATAAVVRESEEIIGRLHGARFDVKLESVWWTGRGRINCRESSAELLSEPYPPSVFNTPVLEAEDIRIDRDAILALWGKKPEPEQESVKQRSEVVRSFPGRPSVMAAITVEIERRAKANELLPTVTEESRYLEGWAEKNFPGQQTPKWKSIKNSLGNKYRSLRGAPKIK